MKPIHDAIAYFAQVAADQKAWLQRKRRQRDQRARRSAWRCATCGGGATEYVKNLKARSCSAPCARAWRTAVQKKRRRAGSDDQATNGSSAGTVGTASRRARAVKPGARAIGGVSRL